MARYIAWFRDIRLKDLPLVGGKNASLGELYGELTAAGVRVPNGFAGSHRGGSPPRLTLSLGRRCPTLGRQGGAPVATRALRTRASGHVRPSSGLARSLHRCAART